MIPDKIYVREYPDGVARFWEEKKKDDVVATIPHEYIRKEALMEWANKRLEEFRHIAEISNDVAADGEVDAFEELIDKLNEM